MKCRRNMMGVSVNANKNWRPTIGVPTRDRNHGRASPTRRLDEPQYPRSSLGERTGGRNSARRCPGRPSRPDRAGTGQRRGAHSPHGLEFVELVRLQHQRGADPADGGCDRQQRHAGPGLQLRRGRRLLVQPQPRQLRQHPGRPQPVPQRNEGARRLPARPEPEVRPLPGAGRQDLRPVLRRLPRRDRQPGPRGAGRAPVRRLGCRLPQVRLVLAGGQHQRPGDHLRQDA